MVRHKQVCTRVDSEGQNMCLSPCPARGSNPGSSDFNSDFLISEVREDNYVSYIDLVRTRRHNHNELLSQEAYGAENCCWRHREYYCRFQKPNVQNVKNDSQLSQDGHRMDIGMLLCEATHTVSCPCYLNKALDKERSPSKLLQPGTVCLSPYGMLPH